MARQQVSIKHLQIDKAQSRMFAVIVIAVVISVFALFASKALFSKGLYQTKAVNEKHTAVKQLKDNISSAKTLSTKYKIFVELDPNMLGGNMSAQDNLGGDNSRITLDSLPSKYDFPALGSSLEKILLLRGVTIRSINGKDDGVSNIDKAQASPKATTIAFSFEATTNYKNAQELIKDFERSIRPFDIQTLEINGTDNNLRIVVTANTYYQPGKSATSDAVKEVK